MVGIALLALAVSICAFLRVWKYRFYKSMVDAGLISRLPFEAVFRNRYHRFGRKR